MPAALYHSAQGGISFPAVVLSMLKQVLIVEDSETCAETLQIALESIPGLGNARHSQRSRGHRRAAGKQWRDRGHRHRSAHAAIGWLRSDLSQVRAEPRFARLPILLISGDSDPLLAESALAQGADAFFPKPYSPSAVRKKLEQLLC